MNNLDKFNDFVDEINKGLISNDKWCEVNNILQWILRKAWTRQLHYLSFPDKKEHTINEGLELVFNFIQKVYSERVELCKKYNDQLYKMMKQISDLEKSSDSLNMEKLKKIQEILNS